MEAPDAAFRGELRSALRRRAIESGIDPVRVRSLLHAVDQAADDILAGAAFATVVRYVHGTVATLFPSSPELDRALLEEATNILMVAAIQAGTGPGAQVLDQILAQTGPVTATDGERRDDGNDRIPDHIRTLRREIDADPALRALFAARAVGVCLTDRDGILVKANDRYRAILGIVEPDAMGIRHDLLLHDRFQFTEAQRDALARHASHNERRLSYDGLVHRPDGSTAWIVADSTLIEGPDGEPRYFLGLVEDVTPERIAMRARGQGDERFLTLIQHASDIFGIVSRQGRIEYVSRSVERALGYDPDTLHGTDFLDLAAPHDREALAAAFTAAPEQPQESRRVGATLIHRDGTPRWMEIDLTTLDDVDGMSGVVVSARDATSRKSAEEQLQRLAYFDSLTGLPNRVQFRERLEAALDTAAATGVTTGVIFIDLDRFKAINDLLGHDGGDTALVAVGERLMSAVQPGDLAARYGGEEFAVLLNDTSPARAMRVARRVIRAVATAFAGHGALSASAGVALRSDGMHTSRELLRAADLALYRSKARGGGVATLYRPGLAIRESERDIRDDLRLALERREFEPWFQPEVELHSGALRGFTVQPRWNRPGHGLVNPQPFLGIAAELGIAAALELSVLDAAARQVETWLAQGHDPATLSLSLGVGPATILAAGFAEDVRDILGAFPLDTVAVRIEIDERVLRDPSPELPRVVACLRDTGVEVAAGPFGGGYAAWHHLRQLRIGAIRIDAGGSGERAVHPRDDVLLGAFTSLANRLGMEAMATGLESRADVEAALAAGCAYGQGTWFGNPLPASAAGDLLRRQPLTPAAYRV